MRKAVIGALLGLAVMAAPAQARITLTLHPDGSQNVASLARDQARLDGGYLPTPDITVAMHYVENACNGRACALVGGGPIWIDPDGGWGGTTLFHEAAHAAIDHMLTPEERRGWIDTMHRLGMLPADEHEWWPTNADGSFRTGLTGPGELFADAWADCAMRRVTRFGDNQSGVTGYGYDEANPEREYICQWMYDLGVKRGWTGGESMDHRKVMVAKVAHERTCKRLSLIVRALRADLRHLHRNIPPKGTRERARKHPRELRQVRRALARRVAQFRAGCT